MISNEKIYKISRGLLEYFNLRNASSPTSFLSIFRTNDQSVEYLKKFGPETSLKIVIAMWALSQDKTTSEIEEIYNNLFFATVFYTSGYYHEEECDECNGNGSKDCDYCDGRGEENCNTCDGDGTVECSECEGEGEIEKEDGEVEECGLCDGSGEETCDDCDGSGQVQCRYCGGDGSEDCDYCEAGTITSDTEMDYETKLIASWNPKLKNKCELEDGTLNPVMSSLKLEQSNNIIFLADYSDHDELSDEVIKDEVYCLEYLGDNPKLNFKNTTGLLFEMIQINIDHLIE